MDPHSRYLFGTATLGLLSFLGIAGAIYFLTYGRYLLFVICVLIFLVALDNFFCGARLRKAGCNCEAHYTMPKFK